MLLIVAYHVRNVYINSKNPIIYISTTVLGYWGILGVDIFLIISAWFLKDQKFRIQKVLHIVFQTFTWFLLFTVLYLVYDYFISHNLLSTFYNFLRYFLTDIFRPFWSLNYWFITAYFYMLLISPFLNKLFVMLKQHQLQKLLIVFMFVPIYAHFQTNTITDIFYFAYVYLLVGYLKEYGFDVKFIKKRYIIFLIVIVIGSKFLLRYFSGKGNIDVIVSLIVGKTIGYTGRHSMILLLLAFLIFFKVLSHKPTYNKVINKIASCCLGVYLFHENNVMKFPNVTDTFCQKVNSLGYMRADMFFPFKYIIIVLVLFIVGTILECVRTLVIQKPFMKWFSSKYSSRLAKIDDWLNCL